MNATIDETIQRVEELYRVVTGTLPIPTNGQRAPLPPEVDPVVHVQEQAARMLALVDEVLPSGPSWTPAALVFQDEADTVIAIDVPGVVRDRLHIRIGADGITVSGRRGRPRTPIACDAPVGAFARTFQLVAAVSPEQVSARLDDGVLTIRIRPPQRTQPS